MTDYDAEFSSKKVSLSRSPGLHEQYRQIVNTANKLEAVLAKVESVIDLFVSPVVSSLYSKLSKDCLDLLLDCEFKLEHFRKAEELLWKRVYYDIYRLLKTKRQFVKARDEYLVESHFMSGIGFYSNLIIKLRLHYKIDRIPGAIVPLDLALLPIDELLEPSKHASHSKSGDGKSIRSNNNEDGGPANESTNSIEDDAAKLRASALQWARQAIYRSMIYMGDLARYLLELSGFDSRSLAFELYRAASSYQTECGLPFNQLATLCGGDNYNLDAVCNYMRCCSRPKPFDGAEGNLVKLFELNKRCFEDLITDGPHNLKASMVLASKDPVLEAETIMRSTVITFIRLISDLWTAGESLNEEALKEIINNSRLFREIFNEAMELEPLLPFSNPSHSEQRFCPISGGVANQDKPKYVCPTIMYEFCSISLMLIAKHQVLHPDGSDIHNMVSTLALDLMMHATLKCQRIIMNKVQELRINLQDQSQSMERVSSIPRPVSDPSLVTPETSSPNLSASTNLRVLSRLRQKKAVSKYAGDVRKVRVTVGQDDESELSELEETALSTIDALDISSGMSDNADYQVDDLINLDSSSSDEGAKLKVFNEQTLSRKPIRLTRSQNYELDRKLDQSTNSYSSLPVNDLLTGDLSDAGFKLAPTSNDVSRQSSELGSEIRDRSMRLRLVKTTYAYLYNATYLSTIKVYMDWLLSNAAIIDQNVTTFRIMRACLNDIVGLFVELNKFADSNELASDAGSLFKHAYTGPDWSQKFPLSCDLPFAKLEPLRGAHEANIDFRLDNELDDSELGFVTVQCITAFADALTLFLKNKPDRMLISP